MLIHRRAHDHFSLSRNSRDFIYYTNTLIAKYLHQWMPIYRIGKDNRLIQTKKSFEITEQDVTQPSQVKEYNLLTENNVAA